MTRHFPKVNASPHLGRDYRAHYTTVLVDIVAPLFAADIARFHYQFDERMPATRADRHSLARR